MVLSYVFQGAIFFTKGQVTDAQDQDRKFVA